VGDGDVAIPPAYAAEIASFFTENDRWLFGHACVRACGNRELAEDLVQDTFEAATHAWATLRGFPPASQRAWLRTILANKDVSDFRRRETFRRRQPDLHDRYRGREADTPAEALSRIALSLVTEIIDALPTQQKKIAMMRWLDQMKLTEIAAALDLAEGTVSAALSAVRGKLRTGLGRYYPFGEEGDAP
jgi:RNA polymerase sigma-70 factor (ECF subfamily)